jgi:hypothetical protein
MNIASFIIASFKRSHGPWASALSVPLGYFSWVLRPQDSLPLWLALPISTILVFSICVLVGALQDVITVKLKAPSVIYARQAAPLSSGNRGLMLIIGESEQFGINTMITVYRTQGESGLEIQVGVGYVETINSKGNIQAIVYEEPMVPGDDTWERLGNNDAEILRQLIAKPTMPRLTYSRSNLTFLE